MCYANMVFAPGVEAFLERLARSGACGLIVPDLPQGEAPEVLAACDERGLALVPAGGAHDHRRAPAAIGAHARGFLYTVSVVGTTGERRRSADSFAEVIARAKASTAAPVALGFGIATPEHAPQAAEAGADGVIVGTRLVRAAAELRGPPPAPWERSWRNWRRAWRRPARIRARMGFVLTITAGLVAGSCSGRWEPRDSTPFCSPPPIILVGATSRILSGYLPGRRS